MNLTSVAPCFGELADCDREFFMRLLEAKYREQGGYLITNRPDDYSESRDLLWSMLWLFPEVRRGERTELVVGRRRIPAIPRDWEPRHSYRKVMNLIFDSIGYDTLLDLGYVPEYRRRRLVFED